MKYLDLDIQKDNELFVVWEWSLFFPLNGLGEKWVRNVEA